MAIVGRLTLLPVTLSGSAMGFSSKTSSAPDLVDEKHTKIILQMYYQWGQIRPLTLERSG